MTDSEARRQANELSVLGAHMQVRESVDNESGVPRLAVVLIARNQDWNVGRLIESVLAATGSASELAGTQIVFVDSASTDDTAAIACRYPIRVLRLRPEQPLSAAAGRSVGFSHTDGDLVLFLDGDMELCRGWLERALDVLQQRPDAAGITGELIDVPKDGVPPPASHTYSDRRITSVLFAGGASVYRRMVLEAVGSFNPYLLSDEEPELCLRIRQAGYCILRTDAPMAYHYSDDESSLLTLMRRWRRNLYIGAGQCIRYHLGDDLLWPYLKDRGFGLIPGVALLIGTVGYVVGSARFRRVWLTVWAVVVGATITGDAYRKRSFYRTLHSLLRRVFILDGTVRGFLARPLPPESYPARVDILQWDAAPSMRVGG